MRYYEALWWFFRDEALSGPRKNGVSFAQLVGSRWQTLYVTNSPVYRKMGRYVRLVQWHGPTGYVSALLLVSVLSFVWGWVVIESET